MIWVTGGLATRSRRIYTTSRCTAPVHLWLAGTIEGTRFASTRLRERRGPTTSGGPLSFAFKPCSFARVVANQVATSWNLLLKATVNFRSILGV